jgi:signal transduction histidine kinase
MIDEHAFPNTVESVTRARHYALDACADLAPDVADAVAVMVSELTTNCVRHAATQFTLAIERTSKRIRVAVTDNGPGEPVVRSPTPADVSGRGLRIVRALADDWGVTPAPEQGKTVWFTVAISS